MKTPREQYEEKHGKKTPAIPGGKAAARQQQFEQERGTKLPQGEDENTDGACAADEEEERK